MDLLLQFARFAVPLLPGLFPVLKDFWGKNNLGPMPPDVAAWDAVDAKIDKERETGRS